jgi:ATP adenylyltransferase
LDRLWSPWRAKYIASGVDSHTETCVFCRMAADTENDRDNLVVHRGSHNFIVLNLYPYITGHLLIVPYQHLAELDSASKEMTDELMDLAKKAQTVLREVYSPSGFNLGMNLGSAAGAGIADHFHLHFLPRWTGDTNFMTAIADVRVLPEALETTYSKLRSHF